MSAVPRFTDPLLAEWQKTISTQTSGVLVEVQVEANEEPILIAGLLSARDWECFCNRLPRLGLADDLARLNAALLNERNALRLVVAGTGVQA